MMTHGKFVYFKHDADSMIFGTRYRKSKNLYFTVIR